MISTTEIGRHDRTTKTKHICEDDWNEVKVNDATSYVVKCKTPLFMLIRLMFKVCKVGKNPK